MKFGIKLTDARRQEVEKVFERKQVCIVTLKTMPIWRNDTTDKTNRAIAQKFALRYVEGRRGVGVRGRRREEKRAWAGRQGELTYPVRVAGTQSYTISM